ncbi:MAG: hypothetical protein IJ197_11205 [Bacteroidaceae bacterium]|nr:hypothetical protein [Bacteroidaceae bacterium]
MNHDIPQQVPPRGDRTQDEEDSRIAAIADELQRLCRVHEAERGTGQANVSPFETEQRQAEALAKRLHCWMPMTEVFRLGVPGPSGHENDTYVADHYIYKVNNLLNSGGIVALLRRIVMHNRLFPETAYQLYGFAGFDGRTVQPVLRQLRIEQAHPATQVMIDTYMSAIGFTKSEEQEGRFTNDVYEVWDILPRNVLVDNEGDLYVIDAEIASISAKAQKD